jgi:hypothetical protein
MSSDEELLEASSLGSTGARRIRAKVSPIWVNFYFSNISEELPKASDALADSALPELVADASSAMSKVAAPSFNAVIQAQRARPAVSSDAALAALLLLPLATIVTSSTGKITEANDAAHAVLRMPIGSLIGKAVFAYVMHDDRRRMRAVLSQACGTDGFLQSDVHLTPRHGTGVHSHLALVRENVELEAAIAVAEPIAALNVAGAAAAAARSELAQQDVDARLAGLDRETARVRWVILPDYDAVDGPPSHQQLEALTRLCRLGAEDGDLRATLGQVAQLCVQAVAEADDVSLLVGNPLEPTMEVTSSATAQHLDGLQHVRAGGPSFDAYRTRHPVALDGDALSERHGLANDEQARSVRSLLAVPLVADDLPTGVLTVYASGERSVATLVALRQVMPFVEAAQTLIRDTRAHEEMRRTQEQLEAALNSHAVIEQAKGMIMISLKCDADDAFAHLVRMSSTRHEKVRDFAQSMLNDILTKRSRLLANPSDDHAR